MPQIANSFQLPVGTGFQTEATDGDAWYDAEDFAEYYYHKTSTSYHLGEDWNRNDGKDFASPVVAAANGHVVFAGWAGAKTDTSWGNVVIIQHTLADGSVVSTLYGHLNTVAVSVGSDVSIGQAIGTIGNGNSTPGKQDGIYSPHLHFGLYLGALSSVPLGYSATADDPYANGWVDPSWYVNRFNDPGDTLATATALTSLNTTIAGRVGLTTTTWLGGQHVTDTDGNDYFKFIAPSNGTLTATLSGLSSDIDLRLLSAAGSQLAASITGGTASEQIQFKLQSGQTYVLQVDPNLSAASAYSLALNFSSTTVNHAPVVTAHNINVAAGQAVAASSAIAGVSDQDGDAIVQYAFWDGGSGGGYFTVNGAPQAAGQWITVSAASLGTVRYVGGSSAGSENLYVVVSDGKAWSSYASFTGTTTASVNHAPTVTAHNISVAAGQSVAASSAIVGVSDQDGDAIVQYAFWDGSSGDGHFTVNGTAQAAGQWITVSAASLGTVRYVGGSSPGSENLYVDVSDGKAWSSYATFTGTTTASVAQMSNLPIQDPLGQSQPSAQPKAPANTDLPRRPRVEPRWTPEELHIADFLAHVPINELSALSQAQPSLSPNSNLGLAPWNPLHTRLPG